MIKKNKGIVLKTAKYSESSLIAKIYTEEEGIKNYILKGVRSSRLKKNRFALYQVINVLDFESNELPTRSLHYITEEKLILHFLNIINDPRRLVTSLIIMELSNILIKGTDKELYTFLIERLKELDKIQFPVGNFVIYFILKITKYLGVGISSHRDLEFNNQFIFDLSPEEIKIVEDMIISKSYKNSMDSCLESRGKILQYILRFLGNHLGEIPVIKSIKLWEYLEN